MNTDITLAEALLRRKELNQLLDRMRPIADVSDKLFVTRVKRQNVNESTDNVVGHVPRITAEQVDAYFNYYARQLRLVDAVIQRANWDTKLSVANTIMEDFKGEAFPEDAHENASVGE